MKSTNMRVHYDEEGDFLEISIGKPTKSTATEIKPGVFLRLDDKSHEIKSVGILGFKSKQDMDVQLPINVTFSS